MAEAMTDERLAESLIEWRERVGVRLMHAVRCTHHGTADFGEKAVCVTCFENTQGVGAVVEDEVRKANLAQGRKIATLLAEVERLRAERDEARTDIDRAQITLRTVGKAALTVKTSLTKPYDDAPAWSPWSRFMEQPARDAYNLGDELRRKWRAALATPPTTTDDTRNEGDEG